MKLYLSRAEYAGSLDWTCAIDNGLFDVQRCGKNLTFSIYLVTDPIPLNSTMVAPS